MNWRKIGRTLLFPPAAIWLLLLPTAAVALIWAMLRLAESDPVRIGSYVLAFYTLVVWCARIPALLRAVHAVKNGNQYVRRWLGDPRLRINVTLMGSVLWNGAYGGLQLGLGLRYRSAWSFSLAAYYGLLTAMRAFLAGHSLCHAPGERMARELRCYRACGWVFLVMNLALSGMMLHMVRESRAVRHHEIVTIALAAYTFTSLTMAIVNVARYRRYNSPVFSASKAISLASACVSVLTLEDTMLVTFGRAQMAEQTRQRLLGISGGGISMLIVAMAVYMIVRSSRKIQQMENEYEAE